MSRSRALRPIISRSRRLAAPDPAHPQFDRLRDAFDVALMQQRRVLMIGLGSGGQQVVATLAAFGVGIFDLVDPGTFEAANVGTTMIGHADLGRAKVDVARRAVGNTNPAACVRIHKTGDGDLLAHERERMFCAA